MLELVPRVSERKSPVSNARPDIAGRAAMPGKDEILAALRRVLGADGFSTSKRMSAFLTYVVTQSLAGKADRIKGYSVAVDALGHPDNHDPQTDPSVRVLACRLRQALALYYAEAGANDPIRIDVPKGSYAPRFMRSDGGGTGASLNSDAYGLPGKVSELAGWRKTVFDRIAMTAMHLTAAASAMITYGDGGVLKVLGSHGMAVAEYKPKYSLHTRLDMTMPVIIIDDVAMESRFRGHPVHTVRPAVERLIVVPLQLCADRSDALIVLDPNLDTAFTTRHSTVLCDLAALAALEIETAILLESAGA